VAALTKQDDALSIASSLQKKHFAAYVQIPQKDKFYRVQVGPFKEKKAADAAKKGPGERRLQGILRKPLMSSEAWHTYLRPHRAPETPAAMRLILAILSGAILSLSYRGSFSSLYSWVCLALLLACVLGSRGRVAFACGFLHGLVSFSRACRGLPRCSRFTAACPWPRVGACSF